MPTFIRSVYSGGRQFVSLIVLLALPSCAYERAGAQPTSSSDQGANFSYHSTVSEVRLLFFAEDEQNHPVAPLARDDFAVVDDERIIRDFLSFTPSLLLKLDLVVLIDSSESVRPLFRKELAAVSQLISQWPPSEIDRLSVFSFSGIEVRPVCDGNCRGDFSQQYVPGMAVGGPTPLFDALEVATSSLIQRGQPGIWPVIILFSDGEDTISRTSYHEVSEKIIAGAVQIYSIDLNSGKTSGGTAMLQRITADSGGRYGRIEEGAVRIFSDLISDLHSARVVTYVSPNSGSNFHSLRVLPTHNLNLRFRCRRGYYIQSASAQ